MRFDSFMCQKASDLKSRFVILTQAPDAESTLARQTLGLECQLLTHEININ